METAWSVFYGAVGTLGVLHGIADAFQIPYDQKMIFIWIVPVSYTHLTLPTT